MRAVKNTPASLNTRTSLRLENCSKPWEEFFEHHCDALFQTALLISADPQKAEASLAATFHRLDLSRPPADLEFSVLQEQVVRQSTQVEQTFAQAASCEAPFLLQDGLRPVLGLDPLPRACFVLRSCLGYDVSVCARILKIEEEVITSLLQTAASQLQVAAATTSSLPTWFPEVSEGLGQKAFPPEHSLFACQ